MQPSDLLLAALSRVVAPAALDWLNAEIGGSATAADERRLAIALGLAGRKIGRAQLSLTDDEAATARRLRSGWQPELWAADEAARVLILMASHRRRCRPSPHGWTGCARPPRSPSTSPT